MGVLLLWDFIRVTPNNNSQDLLDIAELKRVELAKAKLRSCRFYWGRRYFYDPDKALVRLHCERSGRRDERVCKLSLSLRLGELSSLECAWDDSKIIY